MGVLVKRSVRDSLRMHADYFVVGVWPDIIQQPLPDVFTAGKRYIMCIVVDE